MKKYFCNPCGYTYDPEKGDPEHGIKPGTAFEDIPADWMCRPILVDQLCLRYIHFTEDSRFLN